MGQSKYNFLLPPELLASAPADPRDASRLFVYDTAKDTIQLDNFYNIGKYLPNNATLVLNKTRVTPSRITLEKQTGGKIVCLFLLNERLPDNTHVRVMVDRKIVVGDILSIKDKRRAPKPLIKCISHDVGSVFVFELCIPRTALFRVLEEYGSMPIPLYLRHTTLSHESLHRRYQTVYARETVTVDSSSNKANILSSVAAPTAGLHFTPRVFERLKHNNIRTTEIILEVGLGTFAPLSAEALELGKLHTEWYQMAKSSRDAISQTRSQGRKLIAVGTTVVRTLESFARLSKDMQETSDGYHPTDIFIREGHKFHLVDCLITNFHLPNSSLIMLVEAFLQYKGAKRSLKQLYEMAITEKFRFYSFGDSMVIL